MENIEKLIKLIFANHVQNDSTFEYGYEALDVLRASISKLEFEEKNPKQWFNERDSFNSLYDSKKSLISLLESGYIGSCVRTGGNSGGNCWDGEASYSAEENIDLNNDYLDKILEAIAPEVTYLTYRNIEKTIIKTLEYTKYEYYGNSDIYRVQLIPITMLITMLQEKNCLLTPDLINLAIMQFENNTPH